MQRKWWETKSSQLVKHYNAIEAFTKEKGATDWQRRLFWDQTGINHFRIPMEKKEKMLKKRHKGEDEPAMNELFNIIDMQIYTKEKGKAIP